MRFILIITLCLLLSSPLLATGDKNTSPPFTTSSPSWADYEDDDDTPITLPWKKSEQLTASEPLPSSTSSSSTSATACISETPQKAHYPLNISDFIDAGEEAKANFIQDIHLLFPLPPYTEHEDIVTILKKYCEEIKFTKSSRGIQDSLKERLHHLWQMALPEQHVIQKSALAPIPEKKQSAYTFSKTSFEKAINTYNSTQQTSDPFVLCRKHADNNLFTPYYACLTYLASVDYLTNTFSNDHPDCESFLQRALAYAQKSRVPEVIARVFFGFEKYYGLCLNDPKSADDYRAKITTCLHPPIPQPLPVVSSEVGSSLVIQQNPPRRIKQHAIKTKEPYVPVVHPESLTSMISFIDYHLAKEHINGLIYWPFEEEKWELINTNLRSGHKDVVLDNVLRTRATSLHNTKTFDLLHELHLTWPQFFRQEVTKLEDRYLSDLYDQSQTPNQRESTVCLLGRLYEHQNLDAKAEAVFKQGLTLYPTSPLLHYYYAELLWKNPQKRLNALAELEYALNYAKAQKNSELIAQILLSKLNHYVNTKNELKSCMDALESLDQNALSYKLRRRLSLNKYCYACAHITNVERKKILTHLLRVFYLTDPDKAATHLAQGLSLCHFLTVPSKEAESIFARSLEFLPKNILPTTTARYLTLIGLYYERVRKNAPLANKYFAEAATYLPPAEEPLLLTQPTQNVIPLPAPSVFSSGAPAPQQTLSGVPFPQQVTVKVALELSPITQEITQQIVQLRGLMKEAQSFLNHAQTTLDALSLALIDLPK